MLNKHLYRCFKLSLDILRNDHKKKPRYYILVNTVLSMW